LGGNFGVFVPGTDSELYYLLGNSENFGGMPFGVKALKYCETFRSCTIRMRLVTPLLKRGSFW